VAVTFLQEGGDNIKRTVYSISKAVKWKKLGYKITTMSYFGCFGETPMAFHLTKEL
jgi:hypothetical protein